MLVLIIVVPVTTHARNFLRTLKVGDYGDDVTFVQKVLNLLPLTQVATSGLGSPGNETSFFGPATYKAIIKFQNLYANDILQPAGLSYATGVVGGFTEKKLNDLYLAYQNNQKAIQASSTQAKPQVAAVTGTPFILSISPSTFGNGDIVQIKGRNFDSSDNTVLLSIENDDKFVRIPSSDTKTLSISANLTFAYAMQKGMSTLSGDDRARAIAFLISKGQFVAGPGDGSAYMNATIEVKNKNGESNYSNVLVRVINK